MAGRQSEPGGRKHDERGYVGGFVYAYFGDSGDDPMHHWVVFGALLGYFVGGGIGLLVGIVWEAAAVGGLLGIFVGAVAVAVRVAHEPRPRAIAKVVESIKALGGDVAYDFEYDAEGEHVPVAQQGPIWLLRLYANVIRVNLSESQATDADLEMLVGLDQLRYLSLLGTKVTDAGLAYLRHLSELQCLDLRDTQVTDEGVDALKRRYRPVR